MPADREAIYDTDPDALERLEAKLAGLLAGREQMKRRNAAFRSAHRAELITLTAYRRDRAMPYPAYELQNLSETISRTRARIARLSEAA